jgi:hypothetical protein
MSDKANSNAIAFVWVLTSVVGAAIAGWRGFAYGALAFFVGALLEELDSKKEQKP